MKYAMQYARIFPAYVYFVGLLFGCLSQIACLEKCGGKSAAWGKDNIHRIHTHTRTHTIPEQACIEKFYLHFNIFMMMKIELFFDMRFSTHFFNAQAYAFAQKLQLKKIHPVTTLLLRGDTVDNKIISLLHKLFTKHFWPFKYIYLQMAVTHNIYIYPVPLKWFHRAMKAVDSRGSCCAV